MAKPVIKSFIKYNPETKAEIKKLSKLNIIAYNGRIKEQKVYLSIRRTKEVEVIIYDLSNFSVNTYNDFNRRIKKLIKQQL